MTIKVKILRESKKKVIKKQNEQEQLDEGIKELVLGAAMMFAPSMANALTIDVYGSKAEIHQVADRLQADGSPEAAQIATKIKDALSKDYDGSDTLDVSEMSLYPEEADYLKNIIDTPEPAPSPELPATQGIGDESQTQKNLFQKLADKFGFGGDKEEAPKAPTKKKSKKKKEKTMQQKIRDANKKGGFKDF